MKCIVVFADAIADFLLKSTAIKDNKETIIFKVLIGSVYL
jgi:hypothetical protein